jgi:hypothetical protein
MTYRAQKGSGVFSLSGATHQGPTEAERIQERVPLALTSTGPPQERITKLGPFPFWLGSQNSQARFLDSGV